MKKKKVELKKDNVKETKKHKGSMDENRHLES